MRVGAVGTVANIIRVGDGTGSCDHDARQVSKQHHNDRQTDSIEESAQSANRYQQDVLVRRKAEKLPEGGRVKVVTVHVLRRNVSFHSFLPMALDYGSRRALDFKLGNTVRTVDNVISW